MAAGDLKIKFGNGPTPAISRIVGSGTAASINNGEPTKEGSSGAAAIMADGDGTTSQNFAGIAKSVSTDTVAAAGSVVVFLPLPNIVYSGQAKTASLANTQALVDALMFKRVVFDGTATWSVDTAASNAATNGVIITGGDYRTSTIYFNVGVNVTKWGNPTTA